MARPGAALPEAGAILAMVDAQGRLALRASPGSRIEALEIAGGKLIARVHARPEGGKANDAVIALVARALGIAPSRIALIRGASAREKLLRIDVGTG